MKEQYMQQKPTDLLEGSREWDDHGALVVLIHILLDLGQPLVLLPQEILLRQVDQAQHWLGCDEQVLVQDLSSLKTLYYVVTG